MKIINIGITKEDVAAWTTVLGQERLASMLHQVEREVAIYERSFQSACETVCIRYRIPVNRINELTAVIAFILEDFYKEQMKRESNEISLAI